MSLLKNNKSASRKTAGRGVAGAKSSGAKNSGAKNTRSKNTSAPSFGKIKKPVIEFWRYSLVAIALWLLPMGVLWHTGGLQVLEGGSGDNKGVRFLQDQGDARTVRTLEIPAYRGVITDRNGEPLAVSTPVVTVWANPRVLALDVDTLQPLAKRLGESVGNLRQRIKHYANKEFMFLSRRMSPEDAEDILALGIEGVHGREEYKRFYPAGEITSQLVGFTNIDDRGQEGLELAYESWLAGVPGQRKVVKDRKGKIIKDLQLLRSEKPGKDLALSIDLRLQYLAYRELKAAMQKFRAASGSVVVLDVESGEVLAMVNQPSFNPNDRAQLDTAALRNRAVTDLLEPGSLIKPMTMVAALESGRYRPHTLVDTSPGYIRIAGKTFVDPVNYGTLDITGILTKSSQVGTTRVAMDLSPESIRDVLDRVGLGVSPGTGFPGETPGNLPSRHKWHPLEHAAMAFGYGISATPLQIAGAYGVLASGGLRRPMSLLRLDEAAAGQRVVDESTAVAVRDMLKTVIKKGGTGTRAEIPVYDVAGKSGTVHKVGREGYQEGRYIALFAGIAPADKPRLVTVVVINDPKGEAYFGGLVAAPVFSKVTADALRLLGVEPVAAVPTLAARAKAAREDAS